MAFLPRPVTRMMLSTPDATASSTPYWMIGLSTSGSISLGCALVAGRNRVPHPAAGKTALRTRIEPRNAAGWAVGEVYLRPLAEPSTGLEGTRETPDCGIERRGPIEVREMERTGEPYPP